MKAKDSSVSVCRGHRNDRQYIAALERSNRTLGSENRRLVRLLLKKQRKSCQR